MTKAVKKPSNLVEENVTENVRKGRVKAVGSNVSSNDKTRSGKAPGTGVTATTASAPTAKNVPKEVTASDEEQKEVESATSSTTPAKRNQSYTRAELMDKFDVYLQLLDNQLQLVKTGTLTPQKQRQGYQHLAREIKTLKKCVRYSVKAKGSSTKNTGASTNRVSGFENPMKISDELSEFANWPKGELKSRTEVTRFLCKYVKDKDLQNPENRTYIIPDEKLQRLLDPNKEYTNTLKYTVMQKLIQPHFIKTVKASA